MPKVSLRTFAIGARQLVVQEALEMIVCLAGVVLVVVDAHDDGDVLVLGRGRDDDLLGAVVDVRLGLVGVGEEAGRLDDDVGAQVAPGQLGRVALGEGLDRLAVDGDLVGGGLHLVRQAAEDAVVLEQVGERRVVGQVVDARRSRCPRRRRATARKKLRPMRPKPLMPTRMVTGPISSSSVRRSTGPAS